ncbi:MAG: hypothetical protein ABI693_02570 [Bryobacteraceae bacterium]
MGPEGGSDFIQELPERYAALGAAVRRAGEQLLAGETAVLASGPILPTYPLLRKATVTTRVFLEKQDRRVVFFFPREGKPQTILDVVVRFRSVLSPPPPIPLPPLEPRQIRHFTVVPPFLFPVMDVVERNRYLAVLRLAPEQAKEAIFFRFEVGVLAIHRRTFEIAWPLGGLRKLDASLPDYVNPLLAIARNIGFWMQEDPETGRELPCQVPTPDGRAAADPVLDVASILDALIRAWCATVAAVENRSGFDAAPSEYIVNDYQADTILRLDSSGTVTFEESDDLFQLLAGLRLWEEPSGPRSRITLRPPDFLASGDVFDALMDALAEEAPVKAMAPTLGGVAAARAFLESAKGGGHFTRSVMRVRRGRKDKRDPDTDLFYLVGELNGIAPAHVMVRARVRVQTGDDGSVSATVLTDGQFNVLFCTGQPGSADDRRELVQAFSRVLHFLADWVAVLLP